MKRQQKIYILTEGGGGKGWGHLIRCSALYQAFSERSFVPQMVVNGDDSCAILLSGMKYQIYNWLKDSQKLFDCLKDARGAVVDSYLAPKPFYERISQLVDGRIIMIDDLKRMEYPRGIVVNPSIYGDKLEYPKKKEVTYLLGRDYIIFRKPFWTVPKKYPREIVQHVFLSLGGTRQNGSLKRLLEILAVNLPF
ncbi:UDP-2,4-diacetamido-2,4,6-trideoxy-beta-L-altropyranose hydrolase, partial [bacterium]|nr:UDP-2,4-diacetamido-2,4,6-trideoxy-beta-L-altropyranose hydrolase [bacterium]